MKFFSAIVAIALPVVADGASFTYDPNAQFGPDNWGNAQTDGENQCDMVENSPIAITDSGCHRYENYVMRAGSCTKDQMKFSVNDHSIKADFPTDGSCELPNFEMPGKEGVYEALQFHIHMGSEHTVNGITFGAEMHIVHKRLGECTEKRCFAVVGLKLNPASNLNNELFEALLEGWIDVHNAQEDRCPDSGKQITLSEEPIDDKYLIDPYQFNRGGRFFHYPGGLTTPPCTEMVWWNLSDEPLSISPEQYTNLAEIILNYKPAESCDLGTVAYHGGTSRPPQPINERTVEKICPLKSAPSEDYGGEEEASKKEGSSASKVVVGGAAVVAASIMGQLL